MLDRYARVANIAISRRENGNDVVSRGLQMKMKIWAAEKLQRMLTPLLDGESIDASIQREHKPGAKNLQQLLRKEERAIAIDKEQVVMSKEMVHFRGPFIYVHDMDEKTRPIILREYPRVAKRTDGEWPQFRSAAMGKCPFVEDPQAKQELRAEKTQQRAQSRQQQHEEAQLNTRTQAQMQPPRRASPRKVLREVHNHNPQIAAPQQSQSTASHFDRQSSFPPMPQQPSTEFVKPSQLTLAREPAASGIQRSAMTSAIQSTMISSAAATGIKASTSKEVNDLKRKVLERSHTGSMSIPGSIPSSHRMQDLAGALRNARAPAPERAAKSKAQAILGGIAEDEDPYAEDRIAARSTRQVATKSKKPTKREPKPGYCENCRDKYDDFEEHITSRKHRKFATTSSNWTELDALLDRLQEN
ncbi:hypothetical protein BT93_L5220 [Corymbia citriodora subsp. variegata]|uniref:DBF4-type domain-containing protein n=1 Tax=Corymbia citriodora subsp. variegata TaxID=360336 RepID=A0A8T0CF74_CORYI|nr:hypothetical protein BT93_L5220 [Corymbia citriodora subsp. variegata]